MHQLKFIFVVCITFLSVFDVDCAQTSDYATKYRMVLSACESDTSLLDPAMVRILRGLEHERSARCKHAIDDVYGVLSQYGYINKKPSSHIISVLTQVVQHKFILPAAGCASTAYMALKSSGLFALSSIVGGGYGFAGLTSTMMLSGMALSAGTYIWNTLCASNKAILDHQRAEAMRAAVWRALQPVQLFQAVNTAVREERTLNANKFRVLTASVNKLSAAMDNIQSGVQECIARAESAVETKNSRDIKDIFTYIDAQLASFADAFMQTFYNGMIMVVEDKARINDTIQRMIRSQQETVELLQSLAKAPDKSVDLSHISQRIADMQDLLKALQVQRNPVSTLNYVFTRRLQSPQKPLQSVVSDRDSKQSDLQQKLIDRVGDILLCSRRSMQALYSSNTVTSDLIVDRPAAFTFPISSIPGRQSVIDMVSEMQKRKSKAPISLSAIKGYLSNTKFFSTRMPIMNLGGRGGSLVAPAVFAAGGSLCIGEFQQRDARLYHRFDNDNSFVLSRNRFSFHN